jgi:beta-galactosidase
VPYRAGTLRAVGSRSGRHVAECELRTVGEPARIRLEPDRDTLRSDTHDLAFVTVEVMDADGLTHPNADHTISFTVDGEGAIAAVGNGDPVSTERYVGDRRSAHKGRCLVVVKSLGGRGEIRLHAEAAGLAAAETAIRVA